MPLHFFDDDDQQCTLDNIILGRSDYHKTWLRGLHKDSIQRKHINEYQATYYSDHRDSINKRRRDRRVIYKEKGT